MIELMVLLALLMLTSSLISFATALALLAIEDNEHRAWVGVIAALSCSTAVIIAGALLIEPRV